MCRACLPEARYPTSFCKHVRHHDHEHDHAQEQDQDEIHDDADADAHAVAAVVAGHSHVDSCRL